MSRPAVVRMVQCLCPSRHAIMAIAYEPGLTAAQRDFGSTEDITLNETNAAGYLRSLVEGLIEQKTINPWCEICRSRDFQYEDRKTKFHAIEDVHALMRQSEEEQAMTNAYFRTSRN